MWRIVRQKAADPRRGVGRNRPFKILKGREAALMRAPLSLIRILKAERGAFKSGRFAWEGLQKRPDQDDPVAGSRQGGFYKTVILRGRCSKNLDPVVDPVTGSAKRNNCFACQWPPIVWEWCKNLASLRVRGRKLCGRGAKKVFTFCVRDRKFCGSEAKKSFPCVSEPHVV